MTSETIKPKARVNQKKSQGSKWKCTATAGAFRPTITAYFSSPRRSVSEPNPDTARRRTLGVTRRILCLSCWMSLDMVSTELRPAGVPLRRPANTRLTRRSYKLQLWLPALAKPRKRCLRSCCMMPGTFFNAALPALRRKSAKVCYRRPHVHVCSKCNLVRLHSFKF